MPSPAPTKTKSNPKSKPIFPPIPPNFSTKKTQILTSISTPSESYTDKSPKGSIDAPIIDLINELNAIDGVVTTSSCSGRVAVFVEGKTADLRPSRDGDLDGEAEPEGQEAILTGSPAGKGGGRWLYVSHDPVDVPDLVPDAFFTRLCGLSSCSSLLTASKQLGSSEWSDSNPRLVKLAFSPLILHLHVATLQHAKPLLGAAINAGFRESGVQSLKALDDVDAGVTLGIRTAGLAFESVVGVVRERDGGEVYESVVTEEFLGVMFGIVNQRFEWNWRRRERFRREVGAAFRLGLGGEWEDGEVRRRRMREEGLRKKKQMDEERQNEVDGGGVGLGGDEVVEGGVMNEIGEILNLTDIGTQSMAVRGQSQDIVGQDNRDS